MKTRTYINTILKSSLSLVLLVIVSCERDVTDEAVVAGFSNLAEVYTDGPIGLGTNFYFPYGDSNFEVINFEDDDAFMGQSALRIDVPNANNPNGNYAGAIFRVDGAGRDLTGYDALTFYAKASQGITLDAIGFGEDFIENKYQTTLTNVSIGTAWTKYIIPIPDPSKLSELRGLFRYADGTQETGGFGYAISLDEIKFEKLGTLAQPRPKIFDGNSISTSTFIGANVQVNGLSQTFNSANGDITVAAAPGYFTFTSSNSSVATVDEFGSVTVVGAGTATIRASINGVDAEGELVIESLGEFIPAPTPTEAPENVISIFSDAYTNVPVDYYNGYFAPFQTTQGQDDLEINGDKIISYTDLNFVGVGTFLNVNPVNATGMTHFHVDINIREDVDPGDFIRLELLNGVQTANEISGSVILNSSQLNGNEWLSFDIPLGEFSGLSVRDALGLIFFVSDATISSIYVDNIYYYKEVLDPSPNVDDSGASQVALPVGFESTTLTYNFFGFEGAVPSIIANPDPSGINPTANVMQSEKTVGAQFFAGNVLDLDAPIDLSTSQKFRMKVWSPKPNIPIRAALETAGGGNQIFVDATVTSANEWVELEWDFGNVYNPGLNYQRVIVFFEFINGLAGDGSTYYFDDLQIID